MNKHCGAVLGILIVFAWSGLAAGKEMHTCALLTSSEVVAAVVTLKLNGDSDDSFPEVSLQHGGAAETTLADGRPRLAGNGNDRRTFSTC